MTRRWIRLDVAWDASDWLVELEPAAQLAWVRLLCWAKVHGKGGRVKAMSPLAAGKKWGIPAADVSAMLEAAQADAPPALTIEAGHWVVMKWAEYQEPDQTATDRKRRQREKEVTEGHGESRMSRRDTRDRGRDPSRDHRPPTETEQRHDPTRAREEPPPHESVEGGPELVAWLGADGANVVRAYLAGDSGNADTVHSILATWTRGMLVGETVWGSLGLEERRAALASAMLDMAAERKPYNGSRFKAFVQSRADGLRKKPAPTESSHARQKFPAPEVSRAS